MTDDRPGAEPSPLPPGSYVPDIIVLLTDGASNAGPAPVDAAQQAADRGIRVFTIGFGTADGGAFSQQCARQFIGREPGRRAGRRVRRRGRLRRRAAAGAASGAGSTRGPSSRSPT